MSGMSPGLARSREVAALRAEVEGLRAALWRCYQASGADTSDDDPQRGGWYEYAALEVERLRAQGDALTDIVLAVIDGKHPGMGAVEFATRALRQMDRDIS